LHLDGRFVAGDVSLPRLPPGRCSPAMAPDGPLRVCSVRRGSLELILAVSATRQSEQRGLFGLGALMGMPVGVLVSGVTSYGLARWALGPLWDLRDRVAVVRAEEPSQAALSEPYRHAELELLRVAIAELVERLAAALGEAQSFAGHAAHELRTPLAML